MPRLKFETLLGDSGRAARAMAAAQRFVGGADTKELLGAVGAIVKKVPRTTYPDKRWFQKSYAGAAPGQDLLAGKGLFYVSEDRKLYLDCTAGHYQMTWGYGHPELAALAAEAAAGGVVWDNHSNIPQAPVKALSAKLVKLGNRAGRPLAEVEADPDALNTVLLGICTGSVACGAALKMSLAHYKAEKGGEGAPVLIVLDGNYHGTDMFTQFLRGMWPEYFTNVEVVAVQPNAPDELQSVFRRCGERVAAFWAEPIMMNREAILIEKDYMQLARRLCDRAGALMVIDEIQTGFWFPEVMMFHQFGVTPDFVVLGKGMTAGFHPLSALLYRRKLDRLEQYDAISTNGNAALAACVGLGCIALVQREAKRIGRMGAAYHEEMARLCDDCPEMLAEARGAGHMSALKFRKREDALGFHRAAVERGLWVRAHAYHEGHSAVLTKFALLLDEEVMEFAVGAFRRLLQERPWR